MQGVFFVCFFRSDDADEALSTPHNTSRTRRNLFVFLKKIGLSFNNIENKRKS